MPFLFLCDCHVYLLMQFNWTSQGPWKKKNLADFGIVTQCIAPMKVNDQYLTNVLLKINAKVYIFWVSLLLKFVFNIGKNNSWFCAVNLSLWMSCFTSN